MCTNGVDFHKSWGMQEEWEDIEFGGRFEGYCKWGDIENWRILGGMVIGEIENRRNLIV